MVASGESWQDVVRRVQEKRDKSIAAIQPAVPTLPPSAELPTDVTRLPSELLSGRECEITERLPEHLLQLLARRELTAVEVVTAFLRRAAIAQQATNCLAEALPREALERARYLDEYLAETGKTIGPLHGLPISVKEHIGMKGRTLTCSFVSWADRVSPMDAGVLRCLEDAGAVFYVRTLQPQMIMQLDTNSVLYGVTKNPWNTNLTSGGSSGGEGALMGMRASCLGLGTDVGGSNRAPAACCGLWGFKPSSYRLPFAGIVAAPAGNELLMPALGPISTSLAGCEILMKSIAEQKPWLSEPSVLPMEWNRERGKLSVEGGREVLKVGIMWDDGIVKPHPPIQRALKEMKEKLERVDGVEVVDWVPFRHDEGWTITKGLYWPDAAKASTDAIKASGEPLRPLAQWILDECDLTDDKEEDKARQMWDKTMQREIFRAQYAAHWNATGGRQTRPVDVILCPAGPGVAPVLDHSKYWKYLSIWNLLDCPAIVFPFGRVDQGKDKVEEGYEPMNEEDRWNYEQYAPERYANAPIGLQLVARRLEEEKLFEAMDFIRKHCGL